MMASPAKARREVANAKIVYTIAATTVLDSAVTSDILGFKAYNLARMAALGLNVPPAFVIATGFCARPEEVTPAIWRASTCCGRHGGDSAEER